MTALDAFVIGCGRVGSGYDAERSDAPPRTHAGAYDAHPSVRLLGGADPEPAARKAFASRWGLPCEADGEAALRARRPALVSICTPPHERIPLVECALSSGARAIWIEKPLAATSEEAAAIVDLARQAGVPLQVNFHRRFDALHQRVARTLHKLGPPIHADFRYSGSLLNFGSHAFDLFRWFVGEPQRVDALPLDGQEPMAYIEAEGGSSATFLRVAGEGPLIFDADFLTPRHRFSLAAGGEQYLMAEAGPSSVFPGVEHHRYGPPEDGGLVGVMLNGVEALVRAARTGEEPPCTGADGLAAMRTYEAILAAARQRTTAAVS